MSPALAVRKAPLTNILTLILQSVQQLPRAKDIDSEDIIQRIFSQTGTGALKEPVALSQMVDILIDFWEADGLYD
jgi:hypothetical protein